MFTKIMAPVDLAHIESLERALDCAADLAKHYGLPIAYVGVTSSGPQHRHRIRKSSASYLPHSLKAKSTNMALWPKRILQLRMTQPPKLTMRCFVRSTKREPILW